MQRCSLLLMGSLAAAFQLVFTTSRNSLLCFCNFEPVCGPIPFCTTDVACIRDALSEKLPQAIPNITEEEFSQYQDEAGNTEILVSHMELEDLSVRFYCGNSTASALRHTIRSRIEGIESALQLPDSDGVYCNNERTLCGCNRANFCNVKISAAACRLVWSPIVQSILIFLSVNAASV